MKIGSVINHIPDLREVFLIFRGSFKPINFDVVESEFAVTGQPGQQPD
jgi:hypothetical protein